MKGSNIPDKLYLIDAMALAYRAHFIFINRPLVNSKGQNTSASYGFTSALLKLIEDHDIKYAGVVFDATDGEGTFRDEMYEEYKAQRDPAPEELLDNIPVIKEVVEALDIPVLEVSGVEADDVIGTVACRAGELGAKVVIVSPDKDFQQLLTSNISMFRPAYRGESFDPVTVESFRDKFGVEPKQFIDILALMGDASDNVPGVPGIGEKTAMKLVQEFGDVETIIEHAADLKGKRAREGMLNHAEDARLSRELVTIKCDLELEYEWEELHRRKPDIAEVKALFEDLEFRTLYSRVEKIFHKDLARDNGSQSDLFSESASDSESKVVAVDIEADYRLLASKDACIEVFNKKKDTERLSISTYCSSSDAMLGDTIAIAFSTEDGESFLIPLTGSGSVKISEIASSLEALINSAGVLVGHDLKRDIVSLKRSGVNIATRYFDTMVADYLLSPDQSHDLFRVSRKYLEYPLTDEDIVLGTGRNRKSYLDLDREVFLNMACEAADIAGRLYEPLEQCLEENELYSVADDVEFPLLGVLAAMELTGITVDPEILATISTEMAGDLEKVEKDIFEQAGEEFNIGSPAQIGTILFDKLGLPVISKTSTGKPSTKETVLTELATEHELPAMILDWRQLSKLKNTYVDVLPSLANPETGRIHTEFNQTVAATGRLSSQNPNLQNIPIRSERGRSIRRAFVPAQGMRLMSADYVQIELRILASMSDDPGLISAFESGEDIHTATAARVFKIDPKDVTREQRSRAKEVNYGIPYGISAYGLSIRLRCPRSEAQELIDQYHESFPGVSQFLNLQIERARDLGYAETLLGRKRFVPRIHARNRNERAAAERISVNMPIQGSQADMIKIAMLRIDERMQQETLKSRMLLQVHDELVFEVAPGEENTMTEIVRHEMVEALPLKVAVEVDLNIADNWLEAH